MEPMLFKQRVCDTIIRCAADYKVVFLDYEYLIYCDNFTIQPYYTISAKPGNYRHLTGVSSKIPAYDFYEMCLNGTITEDDFNYDVKGVVRNKIIALPLMVGLFSKDLLAKENFSQGRINCSLATADNEITMGFEDRINARPKTLLRGNEIKNVNPVNVSLILRRDRGQERFDTLIQGEIKRFSVAFPDLIADKLQINESKQFEVERLKETGILI
jgi:hypothetical protein